MLGQDTRRHVSRTARREWHDHGDLARRIGLCPCNTRYRRQRGNARGQMQKISAGKFHFEPPSPFTSLDHLVGQCQQLVGNFEAKRLRGLEVDHELELCRQHNRQITRLLAFEDASGVNAGLTVCIGNAGRVAHQAAGRDRFAPVIDRGSPVSGRQRDNSFPLGVHERAGAHVQRASPALDERCKGGLDFAAAADIEDDQLLPIACAAASRSLRSASISGLLEFSDIAAIIVALGTIWCSSSSRFAANTLLRKLTPVTLPPGRLRLATRPSLTGSPPVTKTIGTVEVAALAANAERVLQMIRATWWRTKSATRAGNLWG